MADFVKLDPVERSRTYIFPKGETLTFKNVSALKVSDSGNHRLEADGKKVVIMAGWLAIEIDVDTWTL